MNKTAILGILAASVLTARGATLTSQFVDPFGRSNTITVTFKAKSPIATPPYFQYSDARAFTATNGLLSASVSAGNYDVQIGPRNDLVTLSVPTGTNSYDLGSLITNGLTFTFTSSPTYVARIGDVMTGNLTFASTNAAGFIMNSLTAVQRLALTPTNGMVVYDTTSNLFFGYQNGQWVIPFVPTNGAALLSGQNVFSASNTFNGGVLETATNFNAFVVGNKFTSHSSLGSFFGGLVFDLPPSIYGNNGLIASFDAAGNSRAGFMARSGQFPQLAYAQGGQLNIVQYGATELESVIPATTYTNELTLDASGNVTIANNLTVNGTLSAPGVVKRMSPANGTGNYLTDVLTAANDKEGQLGWTEQGNGFNSGALWLSGALGTGTNTWGRSIDFLGGIQNIGMPYWTPEITNNVGGNMYFNMNYGPSRSTFGYAYQNGALNPVTHQNFWQFRNANAFGGISMIAVGVAHTNSSNGSVIGTNNDNIPLYMNQFPPSMAEISDAYLSQYPELERLSQQYHSWNFIGNDPRENTYFTENTGRPGDTYNGQTPMFILSPTNLNAGVNLGSPSWQGFPLEVANTYTPMQSTFQWAVAADVNSGTLQVTNGYATIQSSNLFLWGSQLLYTNAQNTLVNMAHGVSDLVTNANFAFVGISNVSAVAYQTTTIYLTNSSGSLINFTVPANCHTNAASVCNCTNVTKIDFTVNAKRWTNAISTPLW